MPVSSLTARKAQGLYRQRPLVSQQQGAYVVVQGRRMLNVSSNDYLGLSQHRTVIKAMCEVAQTWGMGSGGSALVSGY